MNPGMVIIGAGEAGARAAFSLREQGWAGPITLMGEEAHAPYERPPLSKATLLDEAAPQPHFIAEPARLETAAITHIASSAVTAIDRGARVVTLADGRLVAYVKLLLATGASPQTLPIAGMENENCVTLRSFEVAVYLRERFKPGARIAIIGGGFIALELAASARRRGAGVAIIEALPRLLNRGVPAEMAQAVQAHHLVAGVTVLCGDGIWAIDDEDGGVAVVLASGKRIPADLAVLGVGAIPNVALAQAAGLAVDNGVAVDGQLRTSDPHIHAAGECCSFPSPVYGERRIRLEAWRNAQEQGSHAASAMLGADARLDTVPWFWSDQYDLCLQVAGLVDEGRRAVRRDGADGAFILFHLADDGRLVAASGIGPDNFIAKNIRLAEMLIACRAYPDPALVAQPDIRLNSLLAA